MLDSSHLYAYLNPCKHRICKSSFFVLLQLYDWVTCWLRDVSAVLELLADTRPDVKKGSGYVRSARVRLKASSQNRCKVDNSCKYHWGGNNKLLEVR